MPLTSRDEPARLPGEERHDAVVDDVQGAHVVVLLPHDEEEGVKELGELGEVVPPGGVGHAEGARVGGRAVDGLAEERVARQPAAHGDLVENPGAEHDLEYGERGVDDEWVS